MGTILNFADRLLNVMSGRGTSIDRRTSDVWAHVPLSPQQVEAAYRSNWLARKIIDIPPLDMTREWRDWQAEGADIEAIEAEEKRHQLRAKCKRALILARLFGGSAIIIGGPGNPDKELRPDNVGKGQLRYLHVVSRHQLECGPLDLDPESPWFGRPLWYALNGQRRAAIHPSRVIDFLGQRQPEGGVLATNADHWGDSVLQSVDEAIRDASTAIGGFAALIDEAKLDIVKIPGLTEMAATPEMETRLANRFAAAAAGKSTYRAFIMDGAEEWHQRQVTWTGMPDMITTYLNIVAGAADIPMTRLLGQSPKGLQSNGDGEERDYHAMVKTRQDEMLAPALDPLDDILIRSALGRRPAEIYWEFAPLGHVNEKEQADIEKQRADTIKTYADTGLIPEPALAAMAKNAIVESGAWPGSETAFDEAEAAAAGGVMNEGEGMTAAERAAVNEGDDEGAA